MASLVPKACLYVASVWKKTALFGVYVIVHKDSVSRLKHFVLPSLKYSSKAMEYKPAGQIAVPVDRLMVTYSRSSGPGGQHVNKVNTKVEIRFHVETADWIPEEVRNKILLQNKNRINKAGELLVTSEISRSQQRNLNDCLQKISDLIAEASQKPREPTPEDLALRKRRQEHWNKERLKQKKIHSGLKQSRRVDFD